MLEHKKLENLAKLKARKQSKDIAEKFNTKFDAFNENYDVGKRYAKDKTFAETVKITNKKKIRNSKINDNLQNYTINKLCIERRRKIKEFKDEFFELSSRNKKKYKNSLAFYIESKKRESRLF